MPVQPRAGDTFTRDNLLLGFSQIFFTPTGGTEVPMGILSSQAMNKVVETLQLPKGDSGTITIDREIVSRIEPTWTLETFNMRSDVARFIFGSDVITSVTADATAAGSTNLTLNADDPFDAYLSLTHGDILESSVAITCQQRVSESVGTGDGATGGTQGDFALDFKIKAIGDVTVFLVGGVDEIAKVVVGSTPAAGEIAIEIGEEDSPVTGSGAITFGASEIPADGAAIVATYTPSFSGADYANPGDFQFAPILGQIRFLHAGADVSPFRLTGDKQPMTVTYTYDRKAHVIFQPFRQNSFDGAAVIRHLPDVGVNFVWPIPSATVRVTDE